MKVRRITEFPHIPICIEMHNSVWTEDFREFKTQDLCAGGILLENPELLKNATKKQKHCISIGFYNVHPVHASHFSKDGLGLGGYVYVSNDTNGKMEIVWEEPVKDLEIGESVISDQRYLP